LLYDNNGNKLYLEVCYSSPVSRKKIDLNIPIIELHIKDTHAIDKIVSKNYISKSIIDFSLYNADDLIRERCFFSCDECIIFRPPPQQTYKEFKEKHIRSMSNVDKTIGDILSNKQYGQKAYSDWKYRMKKKYNS
jgi:hypothetical protein